MSGLSELGLAGLILGSLLAATIVPFSSVFHIVAALHAGSVVLGVFVWATAGSFAGSMSSYWLGYAGKWSWIEKFFKVKQETLEKQQKKIQKWGPPIAVFAWLPFVGDLFSLALGFYKVHFWKVAFYTLAGKALRSGLWIFLYLQYGDTFLDFIRNMDIL